MSKLEKEVDEGSKCIFSGNDVMHYNNGGRKKPDCKTCDGYGADAEKYDWTCYSPRRTWVRFNRNF